MIRNTQQRKAILAVFEASEHPLSPEQILQAAQADFPGLGIATVYREIKRLCEAQAIVPVQIPGEAVRYERSGHAHHHHFKCKRCNGVFDFQGCMSGIASMLPRGFTHHSHEIIVYGVCPGCQ